MLEILVLFHQNQTAMEPETLSVMDAVVGGCCVLDVALRNLKAHCAVRTSPCDPSDASRAASQNPAEDRSELEQEEEQGEIGRREGGGEG